MAQTYEMSVMGIKSLERAMLTMAGPEKMKVVKKAVRAGGKITLKAIRDLAPEDTGDLKKAIVLRAGKQHWSGRYGMTVMINPNLVDWIKAASGTVAEGSRRVKMGKGKAGEKYFYPAAQEFGWTDPGGTYHPPFHEYMRSGFDNTMGQSSQKIMTDIWSWISAAWSKGKD